MVYDGSRRPRPSCTPTLGVRVVPPAALVATALEVVDIAEKSPTIIRRAKESLQRHRSGRRAAELPVRTGLHLRLPCAGVRPDKQHAAAFVEGQEHDTSR